jgi:branched-subunit amino acid transport protein
MKYPIAFSLAVMIVSIYLVRLIPMLLLRRNITNVWVRSFLHYVPYVTLAVMTFPAIVLATDHMASGIIALLAGLVTAYISGDLFIVAISCCAAVYLSGLIIH